MALLISITKAKKQLLVDSLVFMLWEKGSYVKSPFGGVPMLGSLGTFSMFMYGIFLTGQ